MARKPAQFVWILAPVLAVLNLITALIANGLSMPFFLDTWASSLAVMISGPILGTVTGVLSNLLLSITIWDLHDWIWVLSSITVALATWGFWRIKWISMKRPFRTLLAGLLTGLLNCVVTILISIYYFKGLPNHGPTAPIFVFFFGLFKSTWMATIFHHLVIELLDKTVSIFIAVNVAQSFPKGFLKK